MAQIYSDFIEWTGDPIYVSTVDEAIIKKYSKIFMGPSDKEDILIELWKQYGFSGYRNGLLWLVNPDEYTPIARGFKDVTKKAIVFARTSTGNLFIWDYLKVTNSMTIFFYNVHTQEVKIMSDNFESFFNFSIASSSTWKKKFYGEIEFAAVEKFGPIKPDECIAFVPALALGGNENVKNMEPQKILPHLSILSQL